MYSSFLPSIPTAAGLLAAGSSLLGKASAAPLDAIALRDSVTGVNNSTLATLAPAESDDSSSSIAVYIGAGLAGAAFLLLTAAVISQKRNNSYNLTRDAETANAETANAETADSDTAEFYPTDFYLIDFYLTDSPLTDSSLTDSSLTDSSLTDSYLADSKATDSEAAHSEAADSEATDSDTADFYPTDSYPTDSYLADVDTTDSETTDSWSHLPAPLPTYDEASPGLPTYEQTIARQNPAASRQTVGQPEVEPPPAYEPSPSTLRLELGDTPTQSDA